MKKIALISDNHGYAGHDIMPYIDPVDEVWHAGDMGSLESIQDFMKTKTFKGVYGNIDDHILRRIFPQDLHFECEGVKVFMTHIGGYPGRYYKRTLSILKESKPDLYICGHSHICKVMYDKSLNVLHMNPGAYGFKGWHKVRTILRFTCEQGKVKNAEVIELGKRGRTQE